MIELNFLSPPITQQVEKSLITDKIIKYEEYRKSLHSLFAESLIDQKSLSKALQKLKKKIESEIKK